VKLENPGSSLRVKRGLLATRGNAGVPQDGECRLCLSIFHSEDPVCRYAMSTVPLTSAPILVLGLQVDGMASMHDARRLGGLSPVRLWAPVRPQRSSPANTRGEGGAMEAHMPLGAIRRQVSGGKEQISAWIGFQS
jgi:hypothetical protein